MSASPKWQIQHQTRKTTWDVSKGNDRRVICFVNPYTNLTIILVIVLPLMLHFSGTNCMAMSGLLPLLPPSGRKSSHIFACQGLSTVISDLTMVTLLTTVAKPMD